MKQRKAGPSVEPRLSERLQKKSPLGMAVDNPAKTTVAEGYSAQPIISLRDNE